MRGLLITACFMIFLWDSATAAKISGNEKVCQGATEEYEIEDTCEFITNIQWYTFGDVFIISDATESAITAEILVSSGPSGSLSVTYDCNTVVNGETLSVTKTLDLELIFLVIEQPLFSFSHIPLYCQEDTVLELTTPVQVGAIDEDVTYSWTYPPCFSIDGTSDHVGTITTDKGAMGEICLTVSYPACSTSVQECVMVTRKCRPYKVFTASVTAAEYFTSVEEYIQATGDVSTAAVSYVEFRAGEYILLEPGFKGVPKFLAHIAPCLCQPEDSTGCFKFMSLAGYDPDPIAPVEQQTGHRNSVSLHELIRVFPNPSSGSITIDITGFNENGQEYRACVNDMLGKQLKEFVINSPKTTVDLSALGTGVYVITISDGVFGHSLRIVKN